MKRKFHANNRFNQSKRWRWQGNLAINIRAGINGLGEMCVVDRFRSVNIFFTYSMGIPVHELKNIVIVIYRNLRKSEKEMVLAWSPLLSIYPEPR